MAVAAVGPPGRLASLANRSYELTDCRTEMGVQRRGLASDAPHALPTSLKISWSSASAPIRFRRSRRS